jgi:hypothetical protein
MIVECARQLLPVARVTPVPFDAAPRGIGVSIPAPSMRSRTVQSLAMALHKLTTNAVKYGTPKQAESHPTVQWRYETLPESGRPRLHLVGRKAVWRCHLWVPSPKAARKEGNCEMAPVL